MRGVGAGAGCGIPYFPEKGLTDGIFGDTEIAKLTRSDFLSLGTTETGVLCETKEGVGDLRLFFGLTDDLLDFFAGGQLRYLKLFRSTLVSTFFLLPFVEDFGIFVLYLV
jgi:hypothetical protein